jgi:hypothetical protein
MGNLAALQEPVRTLVQKGDTIYDTVNLLKNAYALKNEGEKRELLVTFYSISWKKGELFVEYLILRNFSDQNRLFLHIFG